MPDKANFCGGLVDNEVHTKGGVRPHTTSFEDVYNFGNLLSCARECCNGVRWKQSTQNFEMDMLINVAKAQKQLKEGTFKSKGFKSFYIKERGKTRYIQAVHISERVVQKSLVKNVLKPVILPKLIITNGATLKGKGTHFTIDRVKNDLRYAHRKWGKDFYVLKMDFHNYFGSINHERVLKLTKPLIDKRSQKLLEHFVNNFDGDYGLGLGSEISQILAVFYLNELDHIIKEKYRIKCYTRYMDDLIVVHNDKELLKEIAKMIEEYAGRRGNSLNPHKTMISRPRFIFLKKRFSIDKNGKVIVKVGRECITKARRKIKKLKTTEQINGILVAWKGQVKNLNANKTTRQIHKLAKEVISG